MKIVYYLNNKILLNKNLEQYKILLYQLLLFMNILPEYSI